MEPFEQFMKSVENVVLLTAEEKEFIKSKLSIKRFRKNELVLKAGDVCSFRTFVLKGCLRSYHRNESQDIFIMNFAIENWWIEDLVSFLRARPATLSIDAVEDTEAFQLDRFSWDEILERVPKFEKLFRIQLENFAIAQQKRTIINHSSDAMKKYQFFQQKCRHLANRLPQNHIAAYLGITPQFLSKLRNRVRHQRNEEVLQPELL